MSNPAYLLDASALLALLFREVGADRVSDCLAEASICSVNLSEVVAKLADRGVPHATISSVLTELDLDIVPFEADQAIAAGILRPATRLAGLSLGDRACLAVAQARGAIAVTADRSWLGIDLDIQVEVIR